ncbi:MAG TPA: hypothetical protein VFA75_17960 [Nevskia sp.]|nr:hypothetical protein [Nevskia sp.]
MNPVLTHILIFTAVAIAGMLAHYVKSWAKGEISGNLVDYLFRDNPRATVLSLGGVLTAVATTAATGTLDGMSLQQLLLSGFTTGFAIDSTLNKGGAAAPAAPAAVTASKQGGFSSINLLLGTAAIAVTVALLLGLAGCASTPAPQTPAETVVYVEAAAASADSLADRLYRAGSITRTEAQGVLTASQALQAAVQTAKALIATGDGAGAQAQLQAVQGDLQFVTSFLSNHQ